MGNNRYSREENMKRKLLPVAGILAMLLGLLPGSVFAQAPESAQVVVPVPGPALTVNVAVVNNGTGGQTDPHLSGDWVSYTDSSAYGVRFQNLGLGVVSDRLIPRLDNEYDYLSDISGNMIVFMRTTNLGSTEPGGPTSYSQAIYVVQIDPSGNPGSAVEVSPLSGALPIRGHAAIGGDTIAYEDRSYDGSTAAPPEISLSSTSAPSAPAYRLTNDTLVNRMPAVSPDGNAVVWLKCVDEYTCDVWRAERTAGVWGNPEQVTGADGSESLPGTNGPVTVYASDAGGDVNIRWSVKDASGAYVESVLDLPGLQRSPTISGSLITFQSSPEIGEAYDIWLYDLATNRLYQLTNNSNSEILMDITLGAGGLVRVVWAQSKLVYPFNWDVYAMSFVVDTTPPVITAEIQGTQGQNGWYTSDVTLTWSVTDDQSGITPMTGCEPVSITSDQLPTQYTCSATSAGGTSSASVSIARDATAPTVTITPDRSPDSGTWYNHSVNFTNTCTDETSGRDVFSYREVYSGPNTASYTFWNVCTDRAGNEGKTSFTISYDSTKPVTTVTGVAEGASYTLGSVPPAGCSSTDGLSGVATEATVALTGGDAQGLGDITATCSGALDAAGNAAEPAAVHYTVLSANHAPTAADDTYTASPNTPLEISPAGVLSNDNDEDGDPLSATLVSGPAHGELSLNADGSFTYKPAMNYAGTDSFTYKANDGAADSNIATVNITVSETNTAPTANPGGPYLGVINTAIPFDGSLSSDPENDPLTYAWDFGDGDGGTATGATPAHSYTAAGIYDVCLTVNDGTVDSDPACTIAVVYDPSAGFVTGGGWIDSPAGAYLPDPSLAGKATFGFVSKYKKGASVPTGTTQFQFDVAGLSFYSETYEWLLVNKAGTNAQFKGSGLINDGLDPNGNEYRFMLWAADGSPDTFRIRIWWEDAVEHDVYDNGTDQAIGGGGIVVHTSK
jgi:VCBS repeat-containing protein